MNPRPDQTGEYVWLERHEQVKKLISTGGAKLIFIGDSITHYFGGEPLAKYVRGGETWEKHYARRNAVNMGFGCDQTSHMLWRIQHGTVDGISPKLAIVLAGVNNLLNDFSPEDTAGGIIAVCSALREKLPSAKILLLGVLPYGETPGPQRENLKKTNSIISKIADSKTIHFLDFGSKYIGEDGKIPAEFMPDFLHPNDKGYKIFAEAVEPKIAELLEESPIL